MACGVSSHHKWTVPAALKIASLVCCMVLANGDFFNQSVPILADGNWLNYSVPGENARWFAQPAPGRNKVTAQAIPPSRPPYCVSLPTFTPANLTQDQGVLSIIPLITSSLGLASLPAIFTGFAAVPGAAWNAFAPFHPSAVPIFTYGPSIPRRPAAEQTTRNQNIAIAYAVFTVVKGFGRGEYAAPLVGMLLGLGLDPTNTCVAGAMGSGLADPICIGNKAGLDMLRKLEEKGVNQNGCVGQAVVCRPYRDYTVPPYVPQNTPYTLRNIQAWQPLEITNNEGAYSSQVFGHAYYGEVQPWILNASQVTSRTVPFRQPNIVEYKQQADAVLAASQALSNQTLRLIAEEVDTTSIHWLDPLLYLPRAYDWNLARTLSFYMLGLPTMDGGILTIKEKRLHDTVRPQSAIRYIYGDRNVTAYAGPQRGVTQLPGNEWTSYVPTAPDPDFPSGSVCACVISAEWIRAFTGTTNISMPVQFRQGCSYIEPGISPTQDISVVVPTTEDMVNICQIGRGLGGVHFPQATRAGQQLCSGVADIAYSWLQQYMPDLTP